MSLVLCCAVFCRVFVNDPYARMLLNSFHDTDVLTTQHALNLLQTALETKPGTPFYLGEGNTKISAVLVAQRVKMA